MKIEITVEQVDDGFEVEFTTDEGVTAKHKVIGDEPLYVGYITGNFPVKVIKARRL